MKVIELLNKIANNEIEKGLRFKLSYGEKYEIKESGFGLGIFRIDDNKNIFEYNNLNILNNEIELIEDKPSLPSELEVLNEMEATNSELNLFNYINEARENINKINSYLSSKERNKE